MSWFEILVFSESLNNSLEVELNGAVFLQSCDLNQPGWTRARNQGQHWRTRAEPSIIESCTRFLLQGSDAGSRRGYGPTRERRVFKESYDEMDRSAVLSVFVKETMVFESRWEARERQRRGCLLPF